MTATSTRVSSASPSISRLPLPLLRSSGPVSLSHSLPRLVDMSEYNTVLPPGSGAPLGGQAAPGNGSAAFADAVQRARQVRGETGCVDGGLANLLASGLTQFHVFTHMFTV